MILWGVSQPTRNTEEADMTAKDQGSGFIRLPFTIIDGEEGQCKRPPLLDTGDHGLDFNSLYPHCSRPLEMRPWIDGISLSLSRH